MSLSCWPKPMRAWMKPTKPWQNTVNLSRFIQGKRLDAAMASYLKIAAGMNRPGKFSKKSLLAPNVPPVITAGIKFRPKFGKLAPYGIIGVGGEFEHLTFNFSKYDKFTFIGGGAHLFFSDMISIRTDIRFLNFSDSTRTRFSGGIFFHL